MAATMLSGCGIAANESALVEILDPLVTDHAASLGGDDIKTMRRTGRILISTYDAAALRS
jgi:hypothetical protein